MYKSKYPCEQPRKNRWKRREVARRKVANRFFIAMLSLSLCGVLSFVSSGLALGILRLKSVSSRIDRSQDLPPWVIPIEFSSGSEEKKMLILQSVKDMYLFNGVPPPQDDTDELAAVTNLKKTEILLCVTCSPIDGYRWIAAVLHGSGPHSGDSYSGLVQQSANSTATVSSESWTRAERWSNIDLGIPFGCQDGARLRFSFKALFEVVSKISLDMSVRILITRYSCENTQENSATVKELEALCGMIERRERKAVFIKEHDQSFTSADEVVFLFVESASFSQEQAIAIIHENTYHANPRSLLIVLGADMVVKPGFIYNSMAFVSPGVSAYFPIVWSAFSPRSINVSYVFRSVNKTGNFDKDQGVWMTAGFGVYAMASLDAVKLSMKVNSDYMGWGSEGRDFLTESVSKCLHIVRKLERGATRRFFKNDCDEDVISVSRYCIRSVSYSESSPLAMYVKLQPDRFPRNSLPNNPFSTTILVAITTSRHTFWQRIGLVESTWALKEHLPANFIVKYFVGKQSDDFRTLSHTRENDTKAELARSAQLPGQFLADEAIVILPVDDDDYPPIVKNYAMLEAIRKLPIDIRWIMVVEDDTHVRIAGLLQLVLKYDENAPVLLGSASRVQNHVVMNVDFVGSASCLNGPAFVMSYVMLRKLVAKQDACIKAGDGLRPSGLKKSFWHSKVVSSCVERRVSGSGGCQQDSPGFQSSWFFREYGNESGVTADRTSTVSTHKHTWVSHRIAEADWRDMLR